MKWRIVSNPRTANGKWKSESGCHICGSITNAYIELDLEIELFTDNPWICKGCLNMWEAKIDKAILDQARERV